MITIIFLWLFMPLILVLLVFGSIWLALKWLLHKFDKALEEDDEPDSTNRR